MWKSTLMRDPQTLAQSPKHFRGHQDCSQHLEEGTGAAKFKVTWAILDRAELVLGFSVQARVQVCRADLQGWRGPGLPAWGTGLRGGSPQLPPTRASGLTAEPLGTRKFDPYGQFIYT